MSIATARFCIVTRAEFASGIRCRPFGQAPSGACRLLKLGRKIRGVQQQAVAPLKA
jgi:hypothetical protein